MTLEELRERLTTLNSEAADIRARADAEKRDLSVEETEKLDAIIAQFDRTAADIERGEAIERQTAMLNTPQGRRTQPDNPAPTNNVPSEQLNTNQNPRPRRETVPATYTQERNGGFRTFGDMALAVKNSCYGAPTDPRLERLAAASTYGNEGTGADGGFAVPPDFREAIMVKVLGEDSLLSRCDQVPVNGNNFTCPKDETTPWQTTGGIQAYWDSEAAAATQSKPSLESTTIKLNKLRALVPVTEELMDDAAGMDAYLRKKAPDKIGFKVNQAILTGTGVGQPLGILNSGCLVSVAKETSQVAATLVANNVIKMYARMMAGNRSKAVWLINQDIEPYLLRLSVPGTDNTGNAVTGWGSLVYMPANGLSGSPFGTLFGRPVVPTQACSTLGTKGDIIFADLSQYLALIKAGINPKVDTSIHLWFDQDLIAFKFTLRIGGTPWWSSSIAAANGSTTYSPFVSLDTRS